MRPDLKTLLLVLVLSALAGAAVRRTPSAGACPAPLQLDSVHDISLAAHVGPGEWPEKGTLDLPNRRITFADGTSLEWK